jgi:hypothetical protein
MEGSCSGLASSVSSVTTAQTAAKSDHRHRLLRAPRERPRRGRAAEQNDEVAPFHCPKPPVLSTEG